MCEITPPSHHFTYLAMDDPSALMAAAFLLKELTACWTGLSGPPFFAFPHRH
jgi:hypothetical protein